MDTDLTPTAENTTDVLAEVAELLGTAPTAETPAKKSNAGRKAFPRNEKGEIVYPEGYVKPSARKQASVTVAAAPVYEFDGLLRSGNATFDGVEWTIDGANAATFEDFRADWQEQISKLEKGLADAKQAAADAEAACVKLNGLVNPNGLTLMEAAKTPALLAYLDSVRQTR